MPQPPFDVELSAKQPDGSPGGNAFLSSEELCLLRTFIKCYYDQHSQRDQEKLDHILFVLDCFV